ncbi:hypothetical protein PVAND_016648 [Polypedilum vanderplanki]|uniref:Uncharacterized protein n=1 Tax=Polypedilum vanderplanki TaxID=319348 RepID=A0A9J6BFQ3_POLVA|nr:hypothetical protein PVAND_016648 [Polypedilum vanderplanki]
MKSYGSLKDWDIMWSLEYPFDMFADLLDDDLGLKFHKMNHIPGTFYITNKMMLCTTSVSKYIPVGFSFPNDRRKFQNFALLQENLMFVVKNVNHGGVKLIKPLQIDNMELNDER